MSKLDANGLRNGFDEFIGVTVLTTLNSFEYKTYKRGL